MALNLFHVTPVSKATLQETFPTLHHVSAQLLYCAMKRCQSSEDVDFALGRANFYLGGHGIESVKDNGWESYYLDTGLLYVNMGDSYKATLMFDTRTVRFLVGTLGDYIEQHARRFAEG